jgi:large subunit ribosomal protein L16
MGWGKWSVEMYRAPVKPGRILFEMTWVAPEVAREAFTLAAYKLPVKTKIIVD